MWQTWIIRTMDATNKMKDENLKDKQSKTTEALPPEPQPKTLAEGLMLVIDRYQEAKGIDAQMLLDSVARAIDTVDRTLKQRLHDHQKAERQADFDKVYAERKAAFEKEYSESPYPFKVKHSWISSRKNQIEVSGIRGDILQEVK
jgi:hypothetical protein